MIFPVLLTLCAQLMSCARVPLIGGALPHLHCYIRCLVARSQQIGDVVLRIPVPQTCCLANVLQRNFRVLLQAISRIQVVTNIVITHRNPLIDQLGCPFNRFVRSVW